MIVCSCNAFSDHQVRSVVAREATAPHERGRRPPGCSAQRPLRRRHQADHGRRADLRTRLCHASASTHEDGVDTVANRARVISSPATPSATYRSRQSANQREAGLRSSCKLHLKGPNHQRQRNGISRTTKQANEINSYPRRVSQAKAEP